MRKLSHDVVFKDMVLPKGATVNVPSFPMFHIGITVR